MKIFAGPCVIESEKHCLHMATILSGIMRAYPDVEYYFKASWDKANRTSLGSYRGLGMNEGMRILQKVKEETGAKIITDVHECWQVGPVSFVADIIQIPAFLCRQTDLLKAVAASQKPVNIKKGQWCAPGDMKHVVEKVQWNRHKEFKGSPIWLTERGTTFGYNRNVVDFTGIVEMQKYAPVIMDITHSIQTPGSGDGKSGGNREMAPYLARAAATLGVDGFFMEVHDDPDNALSDGPNSMMVGKFASLIPQLLLIESVAKQWNTE